MRTMFMKRSGFAAACAAVMLLLGSGEGLADSGVQEAPLFLEGSQQPEASVPLNSLAPLVRRVKPGVVNIYTLSESTADIAVRFITSLCGCIALCGLCGSFGISRPVSALAFIGRNALEIYLIHYLLLSPFRPEVLPEAGTLAGAGTVALNYTITAALSLTAAVLLNKNRILSFVLFGRRTGKIPEKT